jgi:protocatechuate 3,4-dioxygenase beta subunit
MLAPLLQVPQTPPAGTASLEGVVYRLGSTDPISGVDLELSPQSSTAGLTPAEPQLPGPASYWAKSGSDGKFAFRAVPSGAYKLVAARVGGAFVPFEYGQHGILGRGVVFTLGEGELKRDVRMEMAPSGSISGRVVDENGKPVGHAAVLALNTLYREGEQVMNLAQVVNTDDNGQYRLFALVPGRYYVAIRPEEPTRRTATWTVFPPGRRGPSEQAVSPVVTKRILPTGEILEETYRFVYFGGTTDAARAVPIDLPPGGNLGAVDVPYSVGTMKSLHIRGKIIDGTTGSPAAGAAVRLVPRAFSSHMIVPTTTANAMGEFDLNGAVAGSYHLYFLGAQLPQRPTAPGVPPPPPPPPLVALLPLDLANSDVENLSITINAASTITGRVSVEGQEGDPGFARMRVTLEAIPTGVAMVQSVTATPSADGQVRIERVWPANYRALITGNPPQTYLKSIRLGQLDLINQPLPVPLQTDGQLDIVLGNDPGSVEGRVTNERQDAAVNVKVALVPDAPYRQRGELYRYTTTDIHGNFRVTSVAPGDYKVFAWEDVQDDAWRDPSFLRLDESRGKPLRIVARKTESTTVTVIPKRRN